jgi:hypothetical protein
MADNRAGFLVRSGVAASCLHAVYGLTITATSSIYPLSPEIVPEWHHSQLAACEAEVNNR